MPRGAVGGGLGFAEVAIGGDEEAGGVAGVDDVEPAGGEVEHGGEHGDEGAISKAFGEVNIEVPHDVRERRAGAHGGVREHVEAAGDEGGGEALAADVGDGEEDFAGGSAGLGGGLNKVHVVAADPAAGGEADGEVEAGDGDVAGDEALLDLVGAGEFAFDGGVVFAEPAGGPRGFGLGELLDGQDGEGEPFGVAVLGGEEDVEQVGVVFFGFDGAGDGGDGHDVGGEGEFGQVGAGGAGELRSGGGVGGEDGFVAGQEGADEGAGDVGWAVSGLGVGEGFGGIGEGFFAGAEGDGGEAVKFGADQEAAECGEALGGVVEGEELLAEIGEDGQVGGGEARGVEVAEGGDAAGFGFEDSDFGRGFEESLGFFDGGQGEVEFAELDVVAEFQEVLGDASAVDEGAVVGAQVADPPAAEGVAGDLGMAAGDGAGVEEDLGFAGAADDEVLAGQREAGGGHVGGGDVEGEGWHEVPTKWSGRCVM